MQISYECPIKGCGWEVKRDVPNSSVDIFVGSTVTVKPGMSFRDMFDQVVAREVNEINNNIEQRMRVHLKDQHYETILALYLYVGGNP